MTVDGCRENGLMMETFSDCVWGVLVGQLLYGQASAIGGLKGLLPLQGAKGMGSVFRGHRAFPQKCGSPVAL